MRQKIYNSICGEIKVRGTRDQLIAKYEAMAYQAAGIRMIFSRKLISSRLSIISGEDL